MHGVIAVRLIVLSLGVALGVFYPFVSVILRERGFSAGEIGLIASIGAIGFTIAVPVWGHLADVRLGRPRTLQICAIGGAVAVAALIAPWPTIAVFVLYTTFTVFESAWQPLTDAITVNTVRGREYGRVRLLTSLSFAIATIVAGFLYDRTGYAPAYLGLAAAAMVMAVAAAFVPDMERADLRTHAGATGIPSAASRPGRTWRFGSIGVALRHAPRLAWVLAAVTLLHIGIISGFTFLGLRITELGGSPSQVALASGLSATVEIPSLLLAGRVARRIGLRGLFAASALLYGTAMVTWTVLDVPAAIIATRAMTGVAFAGVIVSVVLTIAELLPRELQATGQALYQTTAFGVAAVIANAIGGRLYESVGHSALFGLGAILALAAAILGWLMFPHRTAGRTRELAPG